MVDNRASNLVRKHLKANDQKKAISQQQVKKCCCGCPLDATIDYGGHNTCTYHSQQDYRYWQNITMSIYNNLSLINKLSQMTRWTIEDWSEKKDILSQFYFCPMTKLDCDRPTMYLVKFYKALRNKILNEASEQGY